MSWTAQPSGRKARLPANWKAIRLRILKRDGSRCTHYDDGHRCPTVATDVHHVGLDNDHRDSNLASLCGWHHARESARQGGAARAAKGSERRKPEKHPGLVG